MAKDSARHRRPLTSARLKVLADLTRGIGEAVVQGDLDQALLLLKERRQAFQGIVWSREGLEKFRADLTSLGEVDQEILHFCRKWQEVLRERLEAFGASHLLQRCYGWEAVEAKFVDVRK